MGYSEETDYLRVDAFMGGAVEAGALACAFETGLVDYLFAGGPATQGEIERRLAIDAPGARFLLGLLCANNVTTEEGGLIALSAPFIEALRYRDLMEAKLEITRLVLSDFTDLFTTLIRDPGRFLATSRTFDLFSYGRAFEYTPRNYEQTRRWVRFTTALTRYEAAACIARYPFGAHRRMLDVGGNSGEFALQACRRHAGLAAAVLDLPLVCDIGREHIAACPEAARISFIKGNAFADPLPQGFDLISFKSMLHDWPEKDALALLAKAARALAPGGSLLIFERGPIPAGARTPPYSSIPILLFFRYFREPALYARHLAAIGLEDVRVTEIMLDSPFHLVTGKKGRE